MRSRPVAMRNYRINCCPKSKNSVLLKIPRIVLTTSPRRTPHPMYTILQMKFPRRQRAMAWQPMTTIMATIEEPGQSHLNQQNVWGEPLWFKASNKIQELERAQSISTLSRRRNCTRYTTVCQRRWRSILVPLYQEIPRSKVQGKGRKTGGLLQADYDGINGWSNWCRKEQGNGD
jgi:hypothetical protein